MNLKITSDPIEFIGVGAAKSGSTWLSDCLAEHPEVLFSSKKTVKELAFFYSEKSKNHYQSSRYFKGLEWYLNQFPKPEPNKIRGEFTPRYLVDEKSPCRIKKAFPEIKILIALRDPVKRAYSDYWWWRRSPHHRISKSFEYLVNHELFSHPIFVHGLYAQHLKRYQEFFDQESMWVVLLEDIKDNPEAVLESLFSFLGIDSSFRPNILSKKSNSAKKIRVPLFGKIAEIFIDFVNFVIPKNYKIEFFEFMDPFVKIYQALNVGPLDYPQLDPKISRQLREFYSEDIEQLEEVLERDLRIWKEV